ncbi:MAG: ribonuclease H-like domain-containing protein [Candidatus Heimdallarchaeum aukensis]|uniref:DNA polymerase n=1 Tax=Candidatus Heimdallarchaeum aukensis TaxID=2876573 RepID=A0A9Y1BJ56_9ARCH|nr:MAG: ribonuclease H-like domain-containing protein [Candidatus Heimdallarchaeum aukensis]
MGQMNLEKFLSRPNIERNKKSSSPTKVSEIKGVEVKESSSSDSDSSNITFLDDNSNILVVHSDLPASYLISVNYDGEKEQAYMKFYNPEDGKVYRFYDKTEHKPYLLTTKTISEVESILQGNKEFVGCETVEKYNLLTDSSISLTKVYGTNPLAIGGKSNSFREFIKPSYEANIRYHLNYIYDNLLVPGLLYEIKDGKIIQVEPEIDPSIKDEITKIFSSQPSEIHELVLSYFPTFFSPIPDIPRCSLDIEVKSDKGRIPDPKVANDKIISVGFADTSGDVSIYVLNEEKTSIQKKDEKIKVIEFENEKELIEAVFKKINEYPIIITFNGDNFDLPYLNKRAKNLGINDMKNPIITTTSTQNDTYLEYGLHLDLYRFFRQASMRIYAFGAKYDRVTLDELGSTLLGKHKVEHEKDIWDLSLEELIEYNAQDAVITLELTTFSQNQVMELIFMLSRMTKMPIDDFIRSSVSIWIQNWFYYEHRKRNYLIPLPEDILRAKGEVSTEAIIKGKKYQGAIVIQPKAGVWWDVYVLDYASLYPSIIKTRNLSYETIRCKHKECKELNKIPETNHWVCTKKVGIMSMLIGFIRDIRVYWFKEKAKDQTVDKALRVLSNVMQASLKVLINACLPYDAEVIVRDKQTKIVTKLPIGELADCWQDYQILSISREEDETFGSPIFVDIEGYWERSPADLIKIILEDGRAIRLTANHRVPVLLSNFQVDEKYAGELKINDKILVVQNIPLTQNPPETLFIPDLIHDQELYIGFSRADFENFSNKINQPVDKPSIHTIKERFCQSKKLKLCKARWIELKEYERETIRKNLSEEIKVALGDDESLWYNARISIDDDLIRLIAWVIAEGNIQKNHIFISQNQDKSPEKWKKINEVLSRMNLNFNASEKGFVINSKIWSRILEQLCGKYMSNRKIPLHLLNKSRAEIFIEECFKDNERAMTGNNIQYTTVSKQLATDLVMVANATGRFVNIRRDERIENGKVIQTIYQVVEQSGKLYNSKKQDFVSYNGTIPTRIRDIRASSSEPVYDIQTSNGWFVSDTGIVVHNSYGVLGSDNFALYCPPVAESTTALAREAISKTKEHCEKDLGIPVLYGDTDSIFVYQPKSSDIEELKKWSLDNFQIELGIDYVFRYCCLSDRKKNYFGITTKGTPIVKGLMGKKKNTPSLIKRAFDRVLKILSDVNSPEELETAKEKIISIVQRTMRRLDERSFKLEDLAISVTLSKRLKDYESWTQPLQAAIQLLIKNPNSDIAVGSTITFVKTKPFKIKVPSGLLNDKISLSDECSVKPIELATKSDVDVKKMKELVQSTFGQLLDTLGISWKEVEGIKSLDTFFS